MPSTGSRRFTLLDVIVLVAATAAGLGLIRFTWEDSLEVGHDMARTPAVLQEVGFTITYRLAPFLVCLCLAALLCALVPGGGGRRKRLRTPGMIACLAILLVVAVETGRNLALALMEGRLGAALAHPTTNWHYLASNAVLVTWIVFGIAGFWPRARSWPDRFGRWIGWTWIVAWLIEEGCSIAVDRWR